jgi:uncharacterized protein (DUF885 family)
MKPIHALAAVVTLALLAGCRSPGAPRPAAPPNPEYQRLERLFDEYLEFTFRARPSQATELGDHRFDAELDDLSPQAIEALKSGTAAFLARLETEIHPEALWQSGQADLQILRNEIAGTLFSLQKLRPFETDPLVYGTLLSEPVYNLLKRDFAPLESRVRNAIARMKKVPRLIEQAKSNLQAPPRTHVEVALRRIGGAIDFYSKDMAAFLDGSPLAGEALAEGKKVAAALEAYREWLEKDLLPRATGDFRLGRDLWEEKLKYSLDSSLSAFEIFQRAQWEFRRVREEMHQVAKGLWPTCFPGQPLPEGPDALSKTVSAVLDRVSREHSTRQSIVADARKTVDDLKAFIRAKDLLALPDPDNLNVIVMPEFQAGVSTAYLDPAPPLEPGGKSFYAIEPLPTSWSEAEVESRLREYNSQMLKILSIHEGVPGHYVQLEYSNRYPSRIRRVLSNGPMVEGWAVYTERMMVESGFGGGDPRLKLNQLKFYLRAVTNALIDQGLHFGDLTDEAAMKLMVEGGFQEPNEAKGKLVRAKVTSTQLSTYFVGFQEIFAMREAVMRAEGERFSLKDFHQRFLSRGSPPVRVIGQEAFADCNCFDRNVPR